jgi:hypothetical protein
MVFLKKNLILIVVTLVIASCGKMNKDEPIDTTFARGAYTSNAASNCTLDYNAFMKFAHFTSEDVSTTVDCLSVKMDIFSRNVRIKNDRWLTSDLVDQFLVRFFPHREPLVKKILPLFFIFHDFIFDSPDGQMEKTRFQRFLPTVKFVNRSLMQLMPLFDAPVSSREELAANEEKIQNIVRDMALNVAANIDPGDSSLVLGEIEMAGLKAMKDLRPYYFLKTVILGGERDILTKRELLAFLGKAPSLAKISYRLLKTQNTFFSDKVEFFQFMEETVVEFRENVYSGSEIPLFDIEDLFGLESLLGPYIDNLRNFRPVVYKFKEKVIGGHPENFYPRDFQNLLGLGQQYLHTKLFFEKAWQQNRTTIESSGPVRSDLMDTISMVEDYDRQCSSDRTNDSALACLNKLFEIKLAKDFNSIARKWKFYPYEDGSVTYGNKSKFAGEGPSATVEIRFLARLAFEAYGKPHNRSTSVFDWAEYAVTPLKLSEIGFLVKDILQSLPFWPEHNNVNRMMDTALLFADYFQTSSNGDGLMELDEAVQYCVNANASLVMARDLEKRLMAKCPTADSIDARCAKEAMTTELLALKPSLPSWYADFRSMDDKNKKTYIDDVIEFALDEPSMPEWKIRELVYVMGAITNMETLFSRTDSNGNNKVDYKEISAVFPIFRPAIIKFAKLEGSDQDYAEAIFIHLIQYGVPPDSGFWGTLDFIWYYQMGSYKDVVATRSNFAKLVRFINSKRVKN